MAVEMYAWVPPLAWQRVGEYESRKQARDARRAIGLRREETVIQEVDLTPPYSPPGTRATARYYARSH